MIKHILIPTDGSELSIEAAAFGGELARALGARTSVISVLDDETLVAAAWGSTGGPYGTPVGDMSIETTRQQMEKHALEQVLPKTAEALGDVDPDLQVRERQRRRPDRHGLARPDRDQGHDSRQRE